MRAMKYIVFVIIALCAGCNADSSSPLEGLSVTTDRSVYLASDTIRVEFNNQSEDDAFVFHCNHRLTAVVERFNGGQWADARNMNGPVCLGIYESGIDVIFPGSARADAFALNESGRYRLRYTVGTSSQSIGRVQIVSSEFTVQ